MSYHTEYFRDVYHRYSIRELEHHLPVITIYLLYIFSVCSVFSIKGRWIYKKTGVGSKVSSYDFMISGGAEVWQRGHLMKKLQRLDQF